MLRDAGSGGIGTSVPRIDPERNIALYRALTGAMEYGLVRSAHDCSDGGLAVSLAESCFGFDGGAEIDLSELFSEDDELDEWGALFGESLGRICLLYTSPSPRDKRQSRMPSSA